MVFSPKNLINKEGSFSFVGCVNAFANPCLDKKVIRELWHGFTFHTSVLEITGVDDLIFSIGKADKLSLDGSSYSINVEKDGVCIVANGEKDLIMGFMTLLDRIYAEDENGNTVLKIDCCEIRETPLIKNRMVHFCIFSETELWELARFVRLCGALKYSHIILEFWGMLKYDCMSELSWKHAFTKEQIRPIIDEAKDLGMEVIPMFNHWGHASAGRVRHGKHVVLDQNPSLQTYFSDDGWCWNIESQKVKMLLANVRKELMELCGDGEYFHIGCDEAYNFDLTKTEKMDAMCEYLNEIAAQMDKIGRKIIVWGDMFLYKYPSYAANNSYACNSPSPECEKYMLERLDKSIIIADWQYDAVKYPVETARVFTSAGFKTLICPWDRGVNQLASCLDTAKDEGLFGVIHTTWHTLSLGMPYVSMAAVGCFEDSIRRKTKNEWCTATATLLRKVYFVDGDYEKSGWAKKQIGIIT